MYLHIRVRYFSCYCHVSEVKILLKCICDQEDLLLLGDVSRGFARHADGQIVLVVNVEYFSAWNKSLLSHKTGKWFPLCDIIHKFRNSCYDRSLYHIFGEHSVLHFVIILAYIFCNFWKIVSVYVYECVINASVWEHNSSRPLGVIWVCY